MFERDQHGAGRARRQCASTKRLTVLAVSGYSECLPEKKGNGFGDSELTRADNRHQAAFFRPLHHYVLYERQWWGYLRVCRFPLSPVRQPRHLLLTPFGDGMRGLTPTSEAIMPSTTTPKQSPAPFNAGALSVDQLFQAAFNRCRDPRSAEYKAGVRAALAFRIEGKRIARPYDKGSASDDAYGAGMVEGHTIWREAVAAIGGAA